MSLIFSFYVLTREIQLRYDQTVLPGAKLLYLAVFPHIVLELLEKTVKNQPTKIQSIETLFRLRYTQLTYQLQRLRYFLAEK